MSDKWIPQIQAAFAAKRENFCIALAELEYDDPFSAILSYDGSISQPWARVDVRREITSITSMATSADVGIAYAALSNEGDVYFSGRAFEREEIPGAGVLRQGGRGQMYALGTFQNTLLAAGAGGLLYRRAGSGWTQINHGLTAPIGYQPPGFAAMGVTGGHGLYVCGSIFASSEPYDITLDPKYSEDMSVEAMTELFMKNAVSSDETLTSPAGFGIYFDGEVWRNLELGKYPPVNSICAESVGKIVMVGSNGLILTGNADDGFRNISFKGDSSLNLLSVTSFKGQSIIASDHGLHSFDGYILSQMKPRFGISKLPSVPTPFKVQTVDDVLFYFDYKHGVHRFDGKNWEEIVIPPELLERDFKGLPPRK
jgi:hypothetical protein